MIKQRVDTQQVIVPIDAQFDGLKTTEKKGMQPYILITAIGDDRDAKSSQLMTIVVTYSNRVLVFGPFYKLL